MASTTNIFHHAHYPTISPSNPANDQKGRTVLITGGSGGIGYAIAQAFITANASQVILTGRNQDSLNRAATRLAKSATATIVKPFICDLDDEASIETLWQSLDDASITLDVLVLNAAESASSPIRPVHDFLTKLRAFFNTNLFANTLMVSRFLDSLVDKNDTTPKAIINISSFMAHSNPAPFQAAYSTSKAAFAHTLQLLADEVAAEECQIINVHPGAILTEAARNAPQEVKDAVVWDDGEFRANVGCDLCGVDNEF